MALDITLGMVIKPLLTSPLVVAIASKGNKTTQLAPLFLSLLLALPVLICHVFYLQLQTYVCVRSHLHASHPLTDSLSFADCGWTRSSTAWPSRLSASRSSSRCSRCYWCWKGSDWHKRFNRNTFTQW